MALFPEMRWPLPLPKFFVERGRENWRMIATPGVEQAALDLEQVRVDGSAEDPETKETTVEILI